ncbi:aromatic ring-hydroxylating dioxygenase subunit alpha [Roseiarcaceae bacterium H3SJ34-1]|uniref:aromatic ring-hydroxylating dioxygenase subunit alpha n=1 Tax=Terripilifer ovatus TaxID=3032367 RepID=UPI003AB9B078|nr:aromatic ring-hydroxylating dioxygenase subunit alpha [Roseiarcaceae bacterium H3SJ34-1]
MLLPNHWYIAGFRTEITEKPVRRVVAGKPVVLYRTRDGQAAALEDRCAHRHVPLSMGSVCDDGTIQCLYHGIRYSTDGKAVFIPEQTRIPAIARVRSYAVAEKGPWLWVFMGDAALADVATIQSYPWFEREGWKHRTGFLHVKCNYKLIVDNLLNMAHLPYVHPNTIGSEGVVKDAKVNVTRSGDSVRLARRMYDIEPPPTYKQAGGFEGNVNRWQTIDFFAPCYFEFHTGVIEAGHEIPEPGTHTPRSNVRVLDRHTMHAVVPESETSTSYFVGFAYDPNDMDERLADFVFDSTFRTFKEDVEVLEGQQMNMDTMEPAPFLDIVSDSAGLQAMRILDELETRQAAN